MLGVDANHPHHTLAMDDLALVTHFFYGSTDFHLNNPQIFRALNRYSLIYNGK